MIIGQYVGPTFRKRGLETQILDYDHNWDNPEMPLTVLGDPVARKYVAGLPGIATKATFRRKRRSTMLFPTRTRG